MLPTPVAPVLLHVMTIRVRIGPTRVVGDTGKGLRRFQPFEEGTFQLHAVKGGTFETPAMEGRVIHGADWQVLHSDHLSQLDARYTLETPDGHLIYVQAAGRRYGSPEVSARLRAGLPVERREYYGCSTPLLETDAPGLEWMNYHQFIGNAQSEPEFQNIRFYVVDYPA